MITTRGSFICPVCKCSLQRLILLDTGKLLNISEVKRRVPSATYNNLTYYFCCDECKKKFHKNPEYYINEAKKIVVCPSCLAEREKRNAVKINYQEIDVYTCGCPHCEEAFLNDPHSFLEIIE
ncbi:MAG: YHS domain-containing protein [Thermoproteota archaeon]|jgi:YHS domain.